MIVRDLVPRPFMVERATSTQGQISITGQLVVLDLGTLGPSTSAVMVVTTLVGPTSAGAFTNAVRLTGTRAGRPIGPGGHGSTSSARVRVVGLPNTGYPRAANGRTMDGAWPLPWLSGILILLGLAFLATRVWMVRKDDRSLS